MTAPFSRLWTAPGKVLLAWGSDTEPTFNPDVRGERWFAHYRVMRSSNGRDYHLLGRTEAECWFDQTVKPGGLYHYQVVGVRADGSQQAIGGTQPASVPSRRSRRGIPPPVPMNYRIGPSGAGRLHEWDTIYDHKQRSLLCYLVFDAYQDQPCGVVWEGSPVESWDEAAVGGSQKGFVMRAVDQDLEVSEPTPVVIGTAGGRYNLVPDPCFGYGEAHHWTWPPSTYNEGLWVPGYEQPISQASTDYTKRVWRTGTAYAGDLDLVTDTPFGLPENCDRALEYSFPSGVSSQMNFLNDMQSSGGTSAQEGFVYVVPGTLYSVSAWVALESIPSHTAPLLEIQGIHVSGPDDYDSRYPTYPGVDFFQAWSMYGDEQLVAGWNRLACSFVAPPWALTLEVNVAAYPSSSTWMTLMGGKKAWVAGVMVTPILETDEIALVAADSAYSWGHHDGEGWTLEIVDGKRLWTMDWDLYMDGVHHITSHIAPPIDYFDGDSPTGAWTGLPSRSVSIGG